MIFDPDHMSVLARSQALDLIDGLDYSGIVSSHSLGRSHLYRRIMELGGVVTPMAGHADEFDDEWERQRELYEEGKGSKRYGFGFGFGDDMNGFGGPRNPTAGTDAEISYPFNSPIHRAGEARPAAERHEDLRPEHRRRRAFRTVAGLDRGRPPRRRQPDHQGPAGRLRVLPAHVGAGGRHPRPAPKAKARPRSGQRAQLDQAGHATETAASQRGQPALRTRGWRWELRRKSGVVGAAFTRRGKVGLVASDARRYRAGGFQPGTPARDLRGVADHLGGKVWVQETGRASRFVYVLRAGRVRIVGVGDAASTRNARKVKRLARLAVGGR